MRVAVFVCRCVHLSTANLTCFRTHCQIFLCTFLPVCSRASHGCSASQVLVSVGGFVVCLHVAPLLWLQRDNVTCLLSPLYSFIYVLMHACMLDTCTLFPTLEPLGTYGGDLRSAERTVLVDHAILQSDNKEPLERSLKLLLENKTKCNIFSTRYGRVLPL